MRSSAFTAVTTSSTSRDCCHVRRGIRTRQLLQRCRRSLGGLPGTSPSKFWRDVLISAMSPRRSVFSPLVHDGLRGVPSYIKCFGNSLIHPCPDRSLSTPRSRTDAVRSFAVHQRSEDVRKPLQNPLGFNRNNFTDDSCMVTTFQHEIECDWFILNTAPPQGHKRGV